MIHAPNFLIINLCLTQLITESAVGRDPEPHHSSLHPQYLQPSCRISCDLF